MAKNRVVIAEDHRILREGLKSLLSSNEGVEVVGEAGDGLEAIRRVAELQPDLLLLDLSMPRMNGFSTIRDIRIRYPKTRILVLTIHASEDYILEAFRCGAHGYCLKEASFSELEEAIQRLLSGKRYLSPAVSAKVLVGYLEGRKDLKAKSSWSAITPRERDVLKLVGEGYRNKEIAEYLCISKKTVEKHRANIMRKLNLHSRSALAIFALEKGLVTKPSVPLDGKP